MLVLTRQASVAVVQQAPRVRAGVSPQPLLAGGCSKEGGPMSVRVLIADDQAMVREGFSVLLAAQPDIEVVGEAVDGRDAVDKAAALQPDVVLMDVRMPVLNGLAATRLILGDAGRTGDGATGGTRVLVVTTFDLDEYVYEALRAGASGFLLKDASAQMLAEAVRV